MCQYRVSSRNRTILPIPCCLEKKTIVAKGAIFWCLCLCDAKSLINYLNGDAVSAVNPICIGEPNLLSRMHFFVRLDIFKKSRNILPLRFILFRKGFVLILPENPSLRVTNKGLWVRDRWKRRQQGLWMVFSSGIGWSSTQTFLELVNISIISISLSLLGTIKIGVCLNQADLGQFTNSHLEN